MITILFALTRAVHLASCLLFLAGFIFDRLIAAPVFASNDPNPFSRRSKIDAREHPTAAPAWNHILRRFTFATLPLMLLSGIFWFLCVALQMHDTPTLDPHTLALLFNDTTFGTVCKIRLACWLLTTLLTAVLFFRRTLPLVAKTLLTWSILPPAAVLLAALAYTGHGIDGPALHRAADILHLLAAAAWPATLLPFLLLLRATHRLPQTDAASICHALTRRFSIMSLTAVSYLSATGILNAFYLVGSLHALFTTPYGQLLLAKLALFALTLPLAARNLLHWKPRLTPTAPSPNVPTTPTPAAHLQTNITLELTLTTLILLIISLLGLLPHPSP